MTWPLIALGIYLLGSLFAWQRVTRERGGSRAHGRLQAAVVALLWGPAALWDGAADLIKWSRDRRPYWRRPRARRWM